MKLSHVLAIVAGLAVGLVGLAVFRVMQEGAAESDVAAEGPTTASAEVSTETESLAAEPASQAAVVDHLKGTSWEDPNAGKYQQRVPSIMATDEFEAGQQMLDNRPMELQRAKRDIKVIEEAITRNR
jgi:hypothetical protein